MSLQLANGASVRGVLLGVDNILSIARSIYIGSTLFSYNTVIGGSNMLGGAIFVNATGMNSTHSNIYFDVGQWSIFVESCDFLHNKMLYSSNTGAVIASGGAMYHLLSILLQFFLLLKAIYLQAQLNFSSKIVIL